MQKHRKSKRQVSSARGARPAVLPAPAELTIERLAHDGRGIGYTDGRITFVEQALPGEVHRVRYVAAKSKYLEAQSEACLAAPSPTRVAPVCGHYTQCGGCQLQHMDDAAQLAFKQQMVQDQCRRAGLVVPAFEPAISAQSQRYRARCRLSINHKGQAFAGFRQKGRSQLVKILSCPVLTTELAALLEPIQAVLAELPPASLGHIELISETSGVYLLLRHVKSLDVQARQKLVELEQATGARLLLQPEASADYQDLQGLPVAPRLAYELAELEAPVHFKPHHFTQVNPVINQLMVSQAMTWLAPQESQVWLDLFCGVGNFSLPLANRVHRVIGVEASTEMVEQASQNAHVLQRQNCEFLVGDLEQSSIYRKFPKYIHGVLLDPPRAGAKGVIEHLAGLKPAQILYVSCDPATFARDAKLLIEGGYRIKKIGVLDMFPQTMHVETMALFEL